MANSLRLGLRVSERSASGFSNLDCAKHGAVERRAGRRPIEIAAILRQPGKDRGHDLAGLHLVRRSRKLAGVARHRRLRRTDRRRGRSGQIRRETAIAQAGKPVVTANKALLAHHGAALARAAETRGVALNFEGAVAGGIPIVKTMREALAGNRTGKIFGILNGTCNYILTKMADEGRSLRRCAEGSAASGLRRGRSDLRYRRLRYGAQARHPDLARLRHGSRMSRRSTSTASRP